MRERGGVLNVNCSQMSYTRSSARQITLTKTTLHPEVQMRRGGGGKGREGVVSALNFTLDQVSLAECYLKVR